MENTLKPINEKEFMRMAMLKHEETFRGQVNELHRLYRIQKMLMESVGRQQQQQKQELERCSNIVESSKRPFTIDHYQQQLLQQAQRDLLSSTNINVKSTINNNIMMGLNLMRPDNQVLASGSPRLSSNGQEHIGESNSNGKIMMLDESEIELTLSLGPSSLNPRRKKSGKSGESGDQSISSSSIGSSQTKKRSPNNNNSTTTWASFTHQPGTGLETGFSNGQQNSNPPWFHQALSLKLT